jgi:hypothetical protein
MKKKVKKKKKVLQRMHTLKRGGSPLQLSKVHNIMNEHQKRGELFNSF